MTSDTISSRRAFLKVGALIAAPFAAAPAAAMADEAGVKARLDRLEGEAAVRELHARWLRRINAGDAKAAADLFADPAAAAIDPAVRSVTADHAGEPYSVEMAADGSRASGTFHCMVEVETELPRDCTLGQMAHAQGHGFVRHSERRVLTADYVKVGGAWSIARIAFAGA